MLHPVSESLVISCGPSHFYKDNKNPVLDAVEAGIVDLFTVKHWGLKLATNAASTILRVDQVGIKWERVSVHRTPALTM